MAEERESLKTFVINLLDEGQSREQIEGVLLGKGYDERYAKDFIKEAAKLRDAKRRAQGLSLIFGGALVCFLSFLLTITSSFTQGSFPYILYGLTTIGIVIIFTGFMKVF